MWGHNRINANMYWYIFFFKYEIVMSKDDGENYNILVWIFNKIDQLLTVSRHNPCHTTD